MNLEAIRWDGKGCLRILDQLLLPEKSELILVKNVDDGWKVIHNMQVRGAPAIAIVGCLSLAAELIKESFLSKNDLHKVVSTKLEYLVTARPTAVNMNTAKKELTVLSEKLLNEDLPVDDMKKIIISSCEKMLQLDVETNLNIGEFGAMAILTTLGKQKVRLLTHCNTGSLATAGYGTALGVVRSIHRKDMLEHVYCTETRPYNQGARLTAYELVYEKMPATLICDSMASALMNTCPIDAVLVGADRVARNGDTANKIGTYMLAVAAKHHKVPFFVCAPRTSIDFAILSGDEIPIEERPVEEMTHIVGVRISAPGIDCWNPAFDVTPAELITGGIVTEKGVFKPVDLYDKLVMSS